MHPAKIIRNRNPNSAHRRPRSGPSRRRSASPPAACSMVLTARTTVDLNMQKTTDEALTSALAKIRGNRATSGAIGADGDGRGGARDYLGGPDYGESQSSTAPRMRAGTRLRLQGLRLCHRRDGDNADDVGARRLAQLRPLASTMVAAMAAAVTCHWNAFSASCSSMWPPSRRSPSAVYRPHRDLPVRRDHRHRKLLDGARRLRHEPARACRRHRHIVNGARSSKPTRSSIVSSKGDLVYSDGDEPEAPQVVERKVAERP